MRLIAAIVMDVISLAVIALSIWGMVCGRKTGEQRISVLECLRHRPVSAGVVLHALEDVTFERHMWALMLRRDPWALYDPIVRDAIQNPRTEVIQMMPEEMSDPPPAVH